MNKKWQGIIEPCSRRRRHGSGRLLPFAQPRERGTRISTTVPTESEAPRRGTSLYETALTIYLSTFFGAAVVRRRSCRRSHDRSSQRTERGRLSDIYTPFRRASQRSHELSTRRADGKSTATKHRLATPDSPLQAKGPSGSIARDLVRQQRLCFKW